MLIVFQYVHAFAFLTIPCFYISDNVQNCLDLNQIHRTKQGQTYYLELSTKSLILMVIRVVDQNNLIEWNCVDLLCLHHHANCRLNVKCEQNPFLLERRNSRKMSINIAVSRFILSVTIIYQFNHSNIHQECG